jgi:SM-20-related protein
MTISQLAHIVDALAEQDFAIVDDFLDPSELHLLRDTLLAHHAAGHFKDAGIGNQAAYQQNKAVRGDQIEWIEREQLPETCHFFFDRIEALSNYLNVTCYLGIRSWELHFAMYPPGSFYKRHLDAFQKGNARRISVVCYLNADWQDSYGGQLRLYLPANTHLDVTPVGGRLVCFRSDSLEHEVLPATHERLSITGWLKSEAAILPF